MMPNSCGPVAVYSSGPGTGSLSGADRLTDYDDTYAELTGDARIVLEFESECAGFVEIKFAQTGAGTLHIEYGESIYETEAMARSSRYARSDIIVLSAASLVWRSPEREAIRYVRLRAENAAGPVRIDGLRIIPTAARLRATGYFTCNDSRLNDIWKTACRTEALCTQKYLEDGIKRDCLAYPGDVRPEGLSGWYAFGEKNVWKRSIVLFQDYVLPDGSLRHHAPQLDTTVMWDYNCWWIITLRDYWLHTGDVELVDAVFPTAERVMNWFSERTDGNGLIFSETPLLFWGGEGEVTFLEADYYETLRAMSELSSALVRPQDAQNYSAKAETVRSAINNRLWSPTDNAYYRDRKLDESTSPPETRGNIRSIQFGVPDEEKQPFVLAFLKSKWSPVFGNGNYMLTVGEVESLFEFGDPEDGLELTRLSWGYLLDQGLTTFSEYKGSLNSHASGDYGPSLCHGWSAGPAYALAKWVLGVRPAEPGFTRVTIEPKLGDLSFAKGVVPTPKGPLAVDCSLDGGKYSLWLSIPLNVAADVTVPGSSADKDRITVNGIVVWTGGGFVAGCPGVRNAIVVDERLLFYIIHGGIYNFRSEAGTGADTDGDGIQDAWEIVYGLNPNDPSDASGDTDNDGLSNFVEYQYGTSPVDPDTDGDGFFDGLEISSFSDPLDSSSFPAPTELKKNISSTGCGIQSERCSIKSLIAINLLSAIILFINNKSLKTANNI